MARSKKITSKDKQLSNLQDHELFLKLTNQEYAKLKQDKKAWAQEKKEMSKWDITLNDGQLTYNCPFSGFS